MKKNLKRTIKDAVNDWHSAWDGSKSKWAWCLHHDVEIEPLVLPAQNRLDYILKSKARHQQISRIDNFRPVTCKIPVEVLKSATSYKRNLKAMIRAYEAYSNDVSWDNWDLYIKAYNRYTESSIIYIEKLRELGKQLNIYHNYDVPNTTWNGVDIFKPKGEK